MTIGDKYASLVTVQDYGRKPHLEGVELVTLPYQGNEDGNFSEIARMTAGQFMGFAMPFDVRQVSMSVLTPNVFKAYHLHYTQDDIWYVPPFDRLLVNLHDVRKDSPTYDQHMRITLGGGKNLLLRIPSGVAHGAGNIYERNMILFYFTNQQFDPAQPDEQRLPWDIFGADVWEATKG